MSRLWEKSKARRMPRVSQLLSGRRLGRGCQPVTHHHLADAGRVRWCTGRDGLVDDRRDLAEVLGTQHARRDHCERTRSDLALVLEPMNRAAADAEHFTRADVVPLALDRPGQRAVET